MNDDELLTGLERAVRWGLGYRKGLRDRPVRAQVEPGAVAAKLPLRAPEEPESLARILDDFERIVVPAMTHWQHPRFFAYFPANAAPVSVLAEHLTSVLAAQCMLWQTSPAATEVETRMVEWLRDALGLPDSFQGLIQDSATTATLCAVLTMRERALGWVGNDEGLAGTGPLRIYASDQNHSSIDKAVRLAGIGQRNLVKVATDATWSLDAEALEKAIDEDLAAGRKPAGLILCVGGTSIGASDRLAEAIAVARRHDLYVHVDAAWAGSAMICPEFRALWHGVEQADSVVFNPHKWLGAQFDCSVQFLARPEDQVRTLGLRPDYLETLGRDEVVNYNEWTVPLGRRFRALKLWFLLRAHGLEDLRRRLRNHVAWAEEACAAIAELEDFRVTTPCHLSLFTFQHAPPGLDPDVASEELLRRVNDDGRIYLTQTRHEGRFVIRFQVGQFDCRREDVVVAVEVLRELARDQSSRSAR